MYYNDIETFYCDNCGEETTKAYLIKIDGRSEYYCTDACLNNFHSKEEYDYLYDNGKAYWFE